MELETTAVHSSAVSPPAHLTLELCFCCCAGKSIYLCRFYFERHSERAQGTRDHSRSSHLLRLACCASLWGLCFCSCVGKSTFLCRFYFEQHSERAQGTGDRSSSRHLLWSPRPALLWGFCLSRVLGTTLRPCARHGERSSSPRLLCSPPAALRPGAFDFDLVSVSLYCACSKTALRACARHGSP